MQLKIRTKLLLIVGTTSVAFLLVIAGGIFVAARQTRDLTDMENRLVPRLELGPALEARFERLRQSLQDAVAAQDPEALDATLAQKSELIARIATAGAALDAGEGAILRRAIDDYYTVARDVSKRLIAGESGEEIPVAIAEMQAKHEQVSAALRRATRIERREVKDSFGAVRRASDDARRLHLAIALGALGLVVALSLWSNRSMLRGLKILSKGFERFGSGDFSQPIDIAAQDELGGVAAEANVMAESLRRHGEERDRRDWLKAGQVGLSDELRGELEPKEISERALRYLVRRVGAVAGAVYVRGEDGLLRLTTHYGLTPESGAEARAGFRIGEGLVGSAATSDEIVVVEDPPADYLRVSSGLGEGSPRALVFLPLRRLRQVSGVVELGFFVPCSQQTLELLSLVREVMAISLEMAISRAALRELLEETRQQAERLAAQEEELRHNNSELQVQQEELRQANEELEEQRHVLKEQNSELEKARQGLQAKANELAKVSAYKSQFLANMSHELRTPLNSMLLLSELLARNEVGNLSPKQVEYASTVHSAGKDLLGLINQVLELAKIEAGREDVTIESVRLEGLAEHLRRVFGALAADKGLELTIEVHSNVPASIATDRQRVERILVNLLGNAIKFTDRGNVSLRVMRPALDVRFTAESLSSEKCIAFVVSDTGIGIAPEARERVFGAFEQLDSKMDRRYGGSGLGLAIARESAGLLGGELHLQSAPGAGSTFTLYLPEGPPVKSAAHAQLSPDHEHVPESVVDDRASLTPLHIHLLVIEDDVSFAEQLVAIIHARNLKAVVATTGEEGIRLARQHKPHGIILDVRLPGIDGWTVLERLRGDTATKHIPVHIVSGVDDPDRGFALGATGYVIKPVTRRDLVNVVRSLAPPAEDSQRLLVVEDDPVDAESIVNLLRREQLEARHVETAAQAMAALQAEHFSCMILDLGLAGTDGRTLLQELRARPDLDVPPVIVYTGQSLSKEDTRAIEALAAAVILKDGSSEQRLLDEVRLFVRHVRDNLPNSQQPTNVELQVAGVSLAGKRILVADDDMRTVYALSALLQGKGAEVLVADTGREALELLRRNPDVDGVLMDIMMPEMDGYEAMRELRRDSRFASLPIIALTAKAMAGERERCQDAGATDYLAKPVDTQNLLSKLEGCLRQSPRDATRAGGQR